MNIKKVLSFDNKITLACSMCNRQKVVDMTPYLKNQNLSKFKVKCKCGHSWYEHLEKRRYMRKRTNLPGDFILFRNGKAVDSGHMKVVDISLVGLKIYLNRKMVLHTGDTLEVDFTLDNKTRTNIKRRVHVTNINSPFIVLAFEKTDRLDPAIGFYLRGAKNQIAMTSAKKSG